MNHPAFYLPPPRTGNLRRDVDRSHRWHADRAMQLLADMSDDEERSEYLEALATDPMRNPYILRALDQMRNPGAHPQVGYPYDYGRGYGYSRRRRYHSDPSSGSDSDSDSDSEYRRRRRRRRRRSSGWYVYHLISHNSVLACTDCGQ